MFNASGTTDKPRIQDPIKRFEYLLNTQPSSTMIKATPNSVRWNEINQVQYRFQALNFRSDVLEALINASPSTQRRERAASCPKSDKFSTIFRNRKSPTNRARVRCIRSSGSFELNSPNRKNFSDNQNCCYSMVNRKASVVQIAKDDTSDYNSDEEVFPSNKYLMNSAVNYNATICHVTNRKITDTTEIHVSNQMDNEDCIYECKNKLPRENTFGFFPNAPFSEAHRNVLADKTKEELISIICRLNEELILTRRSHRDVESEEFGSKPLDSADEVENVTPSVSKLINTYENQLTPVASPLHSPILRKKNNRVVGGAVSQ